MEAINGPWEKEHKAFRYLEDQGQKTYNEEQLGKNKAYLSPH